MGNLYYFELVSDQPVAVGRVVAYNFFGCLIDRISGRSSNFRRLTGLKEREVDDY